MRSQVSIAAISLPHRAHPGTPVSFKNRKKAVLKITDITIDVIRREVGGTGLESDLGRFGGEVTQGVLRVKTGQGIEGQCFIGDFRSGGRGLFDPILKVLKPELIGKDASAREWLWNRFGLLGARRGVTFPAWAPVDVALWDLAGKAAGIPVFRMLGAVGEEAAVYATYPPRHDSPEGWVEEGRDITDRGFRACKIHPGMLSTTDAVKMARAVRAEVGDDITLMFEPNNNYDFRKALTVGRALDANGFHWFEDPVPWDDFDAVVELSRRLDTPLAMSDLAGYLFREPAHYIRLGAPRILRATARKHGITGMRKIAGMAEAFGLNCEIGTAGNSSLNAANLHVICSISNCDYYEWWMPAEAHQFGLVDHYGLNERMALEVPEIPGLGCVLDEEWIAAHRVETLE